MAITTPIGGSVSAKEAVLRKTGSHWVDDSNHSSKADGISKEEVFFYFDAKWRGRPVQVEVSADKYAHSSGMSDWRVYARAARYYDSEKNGGRGEETTETARRALGKLCVPIAKEWLGTEEYAASFQRALAHMVMRHFQDRYSASRRVAECLNTFRDRLSPEFLLAIGETLGAYDAYEAAKARTFATINGEES